MSRLRNYTGWHGMHTHDQQPGAIPNGTRVKKIMSEEGDAHPDGALATVLGSIYHPAVGYGYFVEWDGHPFRATLVVGHRIVIDRASSGFTEP